MQKKQVGWSDPEHDQRVAVKTVFQTTPPGKGPVFAHCQRIEIAGTATIEVAGGGMMNRIDAAPTVVGREREHANDAADPVIRQTAGKKSAMTAVVLDHEQAYEKAAAGIAISNEAQAWPRENVNQAAVHNMMSGKAVIANSATLRSRFGVL